MIHGRKKRKNGEHWRGDSDPKHLTSREVERLIEATKGSRNEVRDSRLANADVSIDTRKVMVGHASNAMNERYTHLDVEMQDKALEKLSRAA